MEKAKNKKHVLRIAQKDKAIFLAIKSGKKSVETRAATVRNARIKAGDTLVFTCGGLTISKRILDVRHFKSVRSLVKKYPVSAIHPMLQTVAELEKMYGKFPGYQEKIQEFGILAFQLE